MVSQNLKDFQWENRILVIIAEDTQTIELKEQMTILESNKNDLIERKIIVLKVLPQKYSFGFDELPSWQNGSEAFFTYNKKEEGFKVLLIGLDGGVKISQNEPISIETLKEIVDRMPMRRSEIENKN